MNVGILSERGNSENRVSLTPAGARTLALAGHRVMVESGAGAAARFTDKEYQEAGAWVLYNREEVFGRSDLLLKVSALKPTEVAMLRESQTVMAYHHLAASSREMVQSLLASGVTLIGFEVIEDAQRDLPILHAMSEIAGQLAVHVGAHYLGTQSGGRGVLLGGATGIPAAHCVVLGAGVVGLWAARTAAGNGAQVTILDSRLAALRRAEELLDRRAITEIADPRSVERAVAYADLLVGAVLVRGERTPHLVPRGMVEGMKAGSVIVDVSIDQGGCIETSRPTRLDDPVYVDSGVVHYAVPNMASAVARTASLAMTHAALPYVRALADASVERVLRDDRDLAAGVYMYRGELVHEPLARTFSMACQSLDELLGAPAPPGTYVT